MWKKTLHAQQRPQIVPHCETHGPLLVSPQLWQCHVSLSTISFDVVDKKWMLRVTCESKLIGRSIHSIEHVVCLKCWRSTFGTGKAQMCFTLRRWWRSCYFWPSCMGISGLQFALSHAHTHALDTHREVVWLREFYISGHSQIPI